MIQPGTYGLMQVRLIKAAVTFARGQRHSADQARQELRNKKIYFYI